MTRGGKNLVLLGVFSILIAILTTTVALLIYHQSGDIYIDRSRPGFLPDEEEISEEEEKKEEEYDFQKSGKITREVLEEYLEKIEAEIKVIEGMDETFSGEALDFGIPSGE